MLPSVMKPRDETRVSESESDVEQELVIDMGDTTADPLSSSPSQPCSPYSNGEFDPAKFAWSSGAETGDRWSSATTPPVSDSDDALEPLHVCYSVPLRDLVNKELPGPRCFDSGCHSYV